MADTPDGKGGVRAPARQRVGARRAPVDELSGAHKPQVDRADLTPLERSLLSDVFAIVEEHADASAVEIDRKRVEAAFVFACEHHADQRREVGAVDLRVALAGQLVDGRAACARALARGCPYAAFAVWSVSHRRPSSSVCW